LLAGKPSKQIAFELSLSVTTVNLHRSHILSKLQIDSVVDLVRVASMHQARTGGPASPDAPRGVPAPPSRADWGA